MILRILIWILGLSAFFGNIFVIFWRLRPNKAASRPKNAVQSMLVLNLAIADGLMGIYMLIIASADMFYRNKYILHADDWKTSYVCKMAGFLSVLSSEASVFFLTVISLDRWVSITFPFSFKKLNETSCKVVVLIVWCSCLVLSAMPLLVKSYFGDEFYGHSSVCLALPLSRERIRGWEYSVGLFLGFNLVGFGIMACCYISIYITAKTSAKKIKHRSGNARLEQIEMATRMAFLVITDFVCWMPIIIMGLLVLADKIEVPGQLYVWIAVCILPINSSLNPYLYTILTRELTRRKVKKASGIVSSKHQDSATDNVILLSSNDGKFKNLSDV